MKALVCGNAPCLVEQTKGKDLSDFFIVRMNGFKFTPELAYIDAWSSWPEPEHRKAHKNHEPIYDVAEYASLTPELWLCHPNFLDLALNKFKRNPDFILPKKQVRSLTREVGSNPNMGMLMIKAAMVQPRFTEVYVAGFDHYEGPNDYYFMEGKFDHPAHRHADNKRWFEKQIENGGIILL